MSGEWNEGRKEKRGTKKGEAEKTRTNEREREKGLEKFSKAAGKVPSQ